MKKVSALLTEIVLNSEVKPWIEKRCIEAGAEVEWHNVTKSVSDYKDVFRSSPNVITWQCRMPHSWTSSWGNNVLYVDNSLLHQRSGCFVDSRGFYSESNLHKEKHWEKSYEIDCDDFCQKAFKTSAFKGGEVGGYVLLALQCRNDCNINFEFPLAPRCDRVEWFLQQVVDLMPESVRLLIRPHPRERKLFENHPLRSKFQWSMDGDLSTILPKCSSVITVNSTVATEACLFGVKSAVFGTGTFTGSGAVYEFDGDFNRLLEFIDGGKIEVENQKKYCQAVLGAHFLPYRGIDGVKCPEFDRWIEMMK